MSAFPPLAIAILISGKGSNLLAIIKAIEAKQLNANILCVISNKSNALGLEHAKRSHIITHVLEAEKNEPREIYDQRLIKILDKYTLDYVILAGFMRILGHKFIQHYNNRILNIHPSLLPHYPGLNTHERVLLAGEKEHGCTVHCVTEEVDAGPILGQARLAIEPGETPEHLQQRVHRLEHNLYPRVLQQLWRQRYAT